MKILQSYTELMCSGIYKITNITNNKVYIGSSKVIYHRLKSHEGKLETNKHQNQHMQNAYNKYGGENFVAELIERVATDNLEEKEQYYINIYKENYNKRQAFRNSPVSEITKLKISKTLKNKYALGEITNYKNEPFWKKIYVFDLQGVFIKEFPCINQCERFYGISKIENPTNNNLKHSLLLNRYILYGKRELPISVFNCKITNINTGKITYFYRNQDAINILKIPHVSFYRNIGKIYNKGGYKIEYIGNSNRKG